MIQFPAHPDQLKEFLKCLETLNEDQIDSLDVTLPETWVKNPKYLDKLHFSLMDAYPNLAPKFTNLLPNLLPSLGHRMFLGWWPRLHGDWGLATAVNWLQANLEEDDLLKQFVEMVLHRGPLDSGAHTLDDTLGALALERMLVTHCEKILPILKPTIKSKPGLKLFLKIFINQPDSIFNFIYYQVFDDVMDTIKVPPTPDWDVEPCLELVTLAIPYLAQRFQAHLVPLLHLLVKFSYAPMFTILYELIPLNIIELIKNKDHLKKIEKSLNVESDEIVFDEKDHQPQIDSLKAILLQHTIHPNVLTTSWEEELAQLDQTAQQDPTTIVTRALRRCSAPSEAVLAGHTERSPNYESLPFYVYHLTHHLRRTNLDRLPASAREGDDHQLFIQLKSLQQENKSLRDKLDRNLIETQNRQSNHVKWENELNVKLKNFREQVKELKGRVQSLESELQLSKQQPDGLTSGDADGAGSGLSAEIELTRLTALEDENINLKGKVTQLVDTMVQWQTQYESKLPIAEVLSESK